MSLSRNKTNDGNFPASIDINIHGLLIIKTFLIKLNVRNFISKVVRVCKQKKN